MDKTYTNFQNSLKDRTRNNIYELAQIGKMPNKSKTLLSEYNRVKTLTDYAGSIYANSPDPRKSMNEQLVGETIHRLFPTISVSEGQRNYRSIIKGITGDDMDIDSLTELWGEKVVSGFKGLEAGMLSLNHMITTDRNKKNLSEEALKQENDEFLKKMNKLVGTKRFDYYNEYMDTFAEQMVLSTADFVPSMVMSSAPSYLGLALSAICPPAGMIGLGLGTAMAGIMEAGSVSLDLARAGADVDVQKKAALSVGLINGLLEIVGDLPSDFAAKRIGEKLFAAQAVRKGIRGSIAEISERTAKQLVTKMGLEYVGNLVSEPVTEMAQEFVSMYFTNLASKWQEQHSGKSFSKEFTFTQDEIKEALKEVGSSTFKGQLLLGLAGKAAEQIKTGELAKTIKANNIFDYTENSMFVDASAISGVNNKATFKPNENEKVKPIRTYKVNGKMYINPSDSGVYNYAAKNGRGYVFIDVQEQAQSDTEKANKADSTTAIKNSVLPSTFKDTNGEIRNIQYSLTKDGIIVTNQENIDAIVKSALANKDFQNIYQDTNGNIELTIDDKTYTLSTDSTLDAEVFSEADVMETNAKETVGAKEEKLQEKQKELKGEKESEADENNAFLKETENTINSTNRTEEQKKKDITARDKLYKQAYNAGLEASKDSNKRGAYRNAKREARGAIAALTRLSRNLGKGLSDLNIKFISDSTNSIEYIVDEQGNTVKKTNRGYTEINGDEIVINITNMKSPTTALHEVGHSYLSMVGQNFQSIKGFVENFATQLKADAEEYRKTHPEFDGEYYLGRETQEAFAQKLEAYAYSGKAVEGLRQIFNQIIKAVQDFVKAAQYTLTDSERAMFDNIFSTVMTEEELAGNETVEGTYEDSEIDYSNLYSIKNRFRNAVKNKSQYDGKTAYDFYSENRDIALELIKVLPKVEYDGMEMIAGLGKRDMPYLKELYMAKIIEKILDEKVTLLPRYLANIFNDNFGLKLDNQTTVGDSLCVIDSQGKMIEFKYVVGDKVVSNINAGLEKSDIVFVVAKEGENSFNEAKFNHRGIRGINGKTAIIYDLNKGNLFQVKKEGAVLNTFGFFTSTTGILGPSSGLVNYETNFDRNFKYIDLLKNVNTETHLDYGDYISKHIENNQLAFRIDAEYNDTLNKLKANPKNWDGRNWLAPNGEISNLTERQYVQVRTTAFIEWFGDWINDRGNASKVIDYNGEPLPLYHGTNKYGFSTFDMKKGRGSAYFASDKSYAENIIRRKGYEVGDIDGVYSVFLNIRNPLYTYGDGELLLSRDETDIAGYRINDIHLDKHFADEIKRLGYDGVIDGNLRDGMYVVFDSNQIKSATENVGTFKNSSDNIYYDSEIEKEAFDKLMSSGRYVHTTTLNNHKNSVWYEPERLAEKIYENYAENPLMDKAVDAVNEYLENEGNLEDITEKDYPKLVRTWARLLKDSGFEELYNKLSDKEVTNLGRLIIRLNAMKVNDTPEYAQARFLHQFTRRKDGKKNIINLAYKLADIGAFSDTIIGSATNTEVSIDFPHLHQAYEKWIHQNGPKTLSEDAWTLVRQEIIANRDELYNLIGNTEDNSDTALSYVNEEQAELDNVNTRTELYESLKNQTEKDAKEKARLVDEVRSLKERNNQIEKDEDTILKGIDKLKNELGIKNVNNDDEEVSIEFDNGTVTSDIKEILAEVKALKKDDAKLSKELEKNLNRLKELKLERRRLNYRIDVQTEKIREQNNTITGLELAKKQSDKKIEELTEKADNWKAIAKLFKADDISSLRQLKIAQSKIANLKEKIIELKQEIKDEKLISKLNLDDAINEYTKLEKEYKKVETKLEKSEEKLGKADLKKEALTEEYKEKLQKANEKVNAYRTQANALSKEISTYISDLRRSANINESLRSRIEELKTTLAIQRENEEKANIKRKAKKLFETKSGDKIINKGINDFGKLFMRARAVDIAQAFEGLGAPADYSTSLPRVYELLKSMQVKNAPYVTDGVSLYAGFDDLNLSQMKALLKQLKLDVQASKLEQQKADIQNSENVNNIISTAINTMEGFDTEENQTKEQSLNDINQSIIKGTTDNKKEKNGIKKGILYNTVAAKLNTLKTNMNHLSKEVSDLFFQGNKDIKGINQVTNERLEWNKLRTNRLFQEIKDMKAIGPDKELYSYLQKIVNTNVEVGEISELNKVPFSLSNKGTFTYYWNEFNETDFDTKTKLTIQECMAIYEHQKHEADIDHLVEGNHIHPKLLAWIVNEFESEDGSLHEYKDVADAFQKEYGSRFGELQEVAADVEGRYIEEIDVYSADISADSKDSVKMTLNTLNKSRDGIGDLKNSMTKERQFGKNAIMLNYVSGFSKVINDQNAYIAGAKFYDTWDKALTGRDGLQDSIINTKGQNFYSTLIAQINSTRGIQADNPLMDLDSLTNKIRNNYMMARLAFNVSSMLQQPASWFLGISKYGLGGMIKATDAVRMMGIKNFNEFVYSKSIQLENAASLEIEQARKALYEEATGLNKVLQPIKKLGDAGLTMMEKVDRITRNILWYASYTENLNQYSDAEASDRATQWVLDIQSSSQAKDNALVYNSNNPFWKATLMFTNQLNKEWNMFIGEDGLASLLTGENANKGFLYKDYKQFMATLLSLGLSTTWVMLANGKIMNKDDDEPLLKDLSRDFLTESIVRVPVAGNTIKRALEGYSYEQTDDIVSRSVDLFKKLTAEDDGSGKKQKKLKTSAVNFAASATDLLGLPTTAGKRLWNSVYDNYEVDLHKFTDGGWSRILGGEWYNYLGADK